MPASEVPVHRRSNRRSKGGAILRKLLPDSIPNMEIDGLELAPGSHMVGTPHVEGTKEYLVCTEGTLTVRVRGIDYVVQNGDVLAFAGNSPHTYLNEQWTSAKAVSVVALASPH